MLTIYFPDHQICVHHIHTCYHARKRENKPVDKHYSYLVLTRLYDYGYAKWPPTLYFQIYFSQLQMI